MDRRSCQQQALAASFCQSKLLLKEFVSVRIYSGMLAHVEGQEFV